MLELLRMMEMYIQSVTETTVIPYSSNTHKETRVSRRSTRYQPGEAKPKDRSPSLNASTPHEPNMPYVPNRVWYNSTWEDWAQLDVGDILHYPFTTTEIEAVKHYVSKLSFKKQSRYGFEVADFWQYISSFLPGRTPLDCECFWRDYQDGHHRMFNNVIIVRREKGA